MQSLIFVGTFFILFLLMYIFPTWIVYFAWQRGRWGWVRTILFLMPFGLGLVLAPLGLLVSLFSKPTGKILRDNWLRELFYTSIGLGLGQMGAVYFYDSDCQPIRWTKQRHCHRQCNQPGCLGVSLVLL